MNFCTTRDKGSDPRRQANIRFISSELANIKALIKEKHIVLDKITNKVNEYRSQLRTKLSDQYKTRQGIAEEIGRWREIMQRIKNYQLYLGERDSLAITLENKDTRVRNAREELAEMRKEIENDLAQLSQCYRAILRIVISPEAEGQIIIDGNGIYPKVTHVSSSGTTLKTCAHVLSYDFACLLASICGIGHLPRIWMHDSPRAADTEDVLYHRLMSVVDRFEEMSTNDMPTFQHIWTTTSTPPDKLNKEPYVRLRLNGREDSGKLLKCTFGK